MLSPEGPVRKRSLFRHPSVHAATEGLPHTHAREPYTFVWGAEVHGRPEYKITGFFTFGSLPLHTPTRTRSRRIPPERHATSSYDGNKKAPRKVFNPSDANLYAAAHSGARRTVDN